MNRRHLRIVYQNWLYGGMLTLPGILPVSSQWHAADTFFFISPPLCLHQMLLRSNGSRSTELSSVSMVLMRFHQDRLAEPAAGVREYSTISQVYMTFLLSFVHAFIILLLFEAASLPSAFLFLSALFLLSAFLLPFTVSNPGAAWFTYTRDRFFFCSSFPISVISRNLHIVRTCRCFE